MVVTLVLIGIAAGCIAVSYWRARANAAHSQESSDAGLNSKPLDETRVGAELEELQQRFADAVEKQQENLSPIIAATQDFVSRHATYASGYTLLGQVLLQDGQATAAYEKFSRSLEIDGQQPEVHLLAGTIEFQSRRYDRAARHYSMAVGLAQTELRYRLHLAQAQIRLKQFDAARRELLDVLQMDSSSHEAYATLADLYADQNKPTLALTTIQKAIEHTPVVERDKQIAYILRKAQLLRRDNKPEDALVTLGALSPIEQANSLIMRDMALCWAMMGQPGEAAAIYERALASDPTQWRYADAAARWRIKAADYEAARRHVETVRKIKPRASTLPDLEKMLPR